PVVAQTGTEQRDIGRIRLAGPALQIAVAHELAIALHDAARQAAAPAHVLLQTLGRLRQPPGEASRPGGVEIIEHSRQALRILKVLRIDFTHDVGHHGTPVPFDTQAKRRLAARTRARTLGTTSCRAPLKVEQANLRMWLWFFWRSTGG